MIAEGIVPLPFAEGSYSDRLAAIADEEIPVGSVVWGFENTDMAAAKQALGGRQCIFGNVPSDLLTVGTGEQVRAYVTELLDAVATDGGMILSSGTTFDDASEETVRAMIGACGTWRG
jgi:uroporphyrinogen-III decarboxylase